MLIRKRLAMVVRSLFRRRRFEDHLSEELRFHIEEYTADLVRSGMSRDEAARRARMEFGGVETVRDDCRRARGLRLTRRNDPGPALRRAGDAACTRVHHHRVGTIALCLGANLSSSPSSMRCCCVRCRSRNRTAGPHLQHVSEGGRAGRRGVGGELLRAARTSAALTAVSLYREGSALVGRARVDRT